MQVIQSVKYKGNIYILCKPTWLEKWFNPFFNLNAIQFNSGLANLIKLAKEKKNIKYKIYKSKKESFYLFDTDENRLEFILKTV